MPGTTRDDVHAEGRCPDAVRQLEQVLALKEKVSEPYVVRPVATAASGA